jgi:hypothetical protein
MPRSFLYSALVVVVAVAGVANRRHESNAPLVESTPFVGEPRLASCDEAIAAARRRPYWRNQLFAVDCRPAPGGWRLTASGEDASLFCELYVGRDQLIVPHLPCQGVGASYKDKRQIIVSPHDSMMPGTGMDDRAAQNRSMASIHAARMIDDHGRAMNADHGRMGDQHRLGRHHHRRMPLRHPLCVSALGDGHQR